MGRVIRLKMTRIAGGNCVGNDCPTVFTTDRGTIAVQGYVVNMSTPYGEAVVEIPRAVLDEAIHALGG
jgi:hypothetical protein